MNCYFIKYLKKIPGFNVANYQLYFFSQIKFKKDVPKSED